VEALRTPESRFAQLPGFPFEPHYMTLTSGLRQHYVDEGPASGPVVVLLHGQPTWSYLYRTVIPPLVRHGVRVLAPDMIGFGRSDKPTARGDYSVRHHIENLGQLLDQADLREMTLVVQDWGGPIGLGAWRRAPERVRGVVAANTALHTADVALAGRLTWACHSQPDGTVAVESALLDYQRMTQELSLFAPSLFVQGATLTTLSNDVCAAYDAPFPSEDYCAGARQLLTAFSDGDASTEGWDAVLQGTARGAAGQAHCTIAGAGHFLQEDQGPALADVILGFLDGSATRRTP